jgi:hypothetical protein
MSQEIYKMNYQNKQNNGSDIIEQLLNNMEKNGGDNNDTISFNEKGVKIASLVLKRVCHDFSGIVTQIILLTDLPNFKKEDNKKISRSFTVTRNIFLSFFAKERFIEEDSLIEDISSVCSKKNIRFVELTSPIQMTILKKELLNLLFFATEIVPQVIEVLPNGVKVLLKKDICIHNDFIQIISSYEKNPSSLIEKMETPDLVTYKNIFLALFLDDLYRNGKALSIVKTGEVDLFLSIKLLDGKNVFQQGIDEGSNSLILSI